MGMLSAVDRRVPVLAHNCNIAGSVVVHALIARSAALSGRHGRTRDCHLHLQPGAEP
jgi:hypothetical protein